MSDIAESANSAVEHAASSHLNGLIGVLVAVGATFMALCNVKDGNVGQAMAQAPRMRGGRAKTQPPRSAPPGSRAPSCR